MKSPEEHIHLSLTKAIILNTINTIYFHIKTHTKSMFTLLIIKHHHSNS